MIEIQIDHCNAVQTMDIVRQLRDRGWIQGSQFDFCYHPAKESYMVEQDGFFEYISPAPYAVFRFHEPKLATMFSLQYVGK